MISSVSSKNVKTEKSPTSEFIIVSLLLSDLDLVDFTLPELTKSTELHCMQTWLIFSRSTLHYEHFGVKIGFICVPVWK